MDINRILNKNSFKIILKRDGTSKTKTVEV